MKKLLLFFFMLAVYKVQAQDTIPKKAFNKNIILLELSAFGLHDEYNVSLNYARIITQAGFANLYGRASVGVSQSGHQTFVESPGEKFNLGAGFFLWNGSHHLEMQFGADAYRSKIYNAPPSGGPVDETHKMYFYPYVLGGYRYQKPGQAFMLRIATATYGIINFSLGLSF